MIKYLTISGGDVSFFSILGSIKELKNNHKYNIDNIEEIYSISSGCWISLLLCLKINFNVILNYFIERPWNKLVVFNSTNILDLYSNIGIFNIDILYTLFKPLLKLCNLNINITFKELYEYSNIKLNIYSTKYKDLSLCRFNYETEPNMKVIDAIYMSSTIPILFKPLKYNGDYYIDGGYNCNYPIDFCLKEHDDSSEILGVLVKNYEDISEISENENILTFYGKIFWKLILNRRNKNEKNDVDHKKIIIVTDYLTPNILFKILNDKDFRTKWVEIGSNACKTFLEYNSKE